MNILGISAGFHDAAATVIDRHGNIKFAAHSERYSRNKNDANLSLELLNQIDMTEISNIAYYEKPWLKQFRQWYSGQGVDWDRLTVQQVLEQQLGANRIKNCRLQSYNHHLSHAAAGFQTSPFDRATVVVIDAIGEWDTVSIWGASYDSAGQAWYQRLWGQRYPHSIGLFYSAITKAVGLRPMDEEYITMGMAAYGSNLGAAWLKEQFVDDVKTARFKKNLHLGFDNYELSFTHDEDIAASAQELTEELIVNIMRRAQSYSWSDNLVYMGGVALNCLANRKLGDYFEKIWILPNPGDAGSSLGAAALAHGGRINWVNAYLGHDIPGSYPVESAMEHLLSRGIVGVASGRAEFGPRALGNRSLLADPRGRDIKDRVNEIKRRQKFRPFAPAILEEHVDLYFAMPRNWHDSRYMQVVARCWRPDLYPAICHVDGTSRVQTVPRDGSGFRRLLEAWYDRTGCPMLLNTSLNIRGEPMVNDQTDAQRFEKLYNIPVVS